jgi:hypothetical protein
MLRGISSEVEDVYCILIVVFVLCSLAVVKVMEMYIYKQLSWK